MKTEKKKKALAQLDAWLDEKRARNNAFEPKAVEPKNEKEKEAITALDAYLEEERNRDKTRNNIK